MAVNGRADSGACGITCRGPRRCGRRKGRIDGLELVADDGPFTTGTGPLVSGPTLALFMATTGRASYCDDLEGDGVELLHGRCRAA